MSEYTREEILKMIEEAGGPKNLDLSGKDLSGIDLSKEAITKELEKYRKSNPDQTPLWFSQKTKGINLRGATLRNANLLGAHLERANFAKAHLERADLRGALTGAILRGAHLQGAKLRGAHLERANFGEAHLQGAGLRGARLEGANLRRARLEGADLGRAHLEGANLRRAHLEGANLRRAHLEGGHLRRAHLEGADLGAAHLEGGHLGEAHLREAILDRANLKESGLGRANLKEASLRGARLEGAGLRGARLEAANLERAHLEKVDLSVATSLAGAYFHGAWLDQTRMTREQLGGRIGEEIDKEYYEAKEAYLLLKNNFNQIGRYDDASWAYGKERRMERMTHRWDLAPKYYDYPKLPGPLPTGAKGIVHRIWLPFRKVGFLLRHLVRYLFDTAQLALCDFGENPWLTLVWAAVALLLFGLAYMGFGGIEPAPGLSFAISFGDHFVYSLFAFATMDHPRIVATTGLAQFLTAFEALVGIFLAAIFVFTLGNRLSRS